MERTFDLTSVALHSGDYQEAKIFWHSLDNKILPKYYIQKTYEMLDLTEHVLSALFSAYLEFLLSFPFVLVREREDQHGLKTVKGRFFV